METPSFQSSQNRKNGFSSVSISPLITEVRDPVWAQQKVQKDERASAIYQTKTAADFRRKGFPWDAKALELLGSAFGHPGFLSDGRSHGKEEKGGQAASTQRAAMNACLARRDCFVCMPTGSGKSLIWQLA